MKTSIYIPFLAFLITSCNHIDKTKAIAKPTNKWSKDSIINYFKDSIAYRMYNGYGREADSLNNFDKFSKYLLGDIKAKNISDPFILGFDENYIDTTKIDTTKKWLRISVDPVFRTPYCLILEKKGNKSILTLKMTDGHGGYYSGYLNFTSTQKYSDSLYSSISNKLHQLNFWSIHEDTTCKGGMDGEEWTFEAVENGQYNIVSRWVPLSCGNDITHQLALLGVDLRQKSKLKGYLQVRTGMGKQELDEWYPDK